MVGGLGVTDPDSLDTSLRTAIERALALERWVDSTRDGLLSEAFVRRRTQFDSVAAFCASSPSAEDTIGGVQRLAAAERDAFVARTTDFETWPELKQSAAVEELVTLHNI